jgi:O-antigen ligase/tetratricopeptide (TPR) repeat protein
MSFSFLKKLHTAIFFGIILLVFLTPFIAPFGLFSSFASSFFFPYIVPKTLFFYMGTAILFSTWLLLAFFDERYRPRFSFIFLSLFFFLCTIGIANIQGIDFFKSFWSNFERMEGYLLLIHLFAFFIVVGSVLKEKKEWAILFSFSLFGSFIASFMGLVELYTSSGLVRIATVFGNPIYYAVYALFHAFISLWIMMYIKEKKIFHHKKEKIYLTLLFLSLFLQSAMVFLTLTRGSVLALFSGLLITSFLFIFYTKKNPFFFRTGLIFLFIVFISIGGSLFLRGSAFAEKNEVLDRFVNASLSSGTVHARIMNWSVAWEGIKEKPLLGWGQENYEYPFAKYYDPYMYNEEEWFDRAHSFIFDWLIAGGFLGFFAYCTLFFVLFFTIIFSSSKTLKRHIPSFIKSKDTIFSPVEKSILIGLISAYLIHNAFVFDSLMSYVLIFLIFAFVHSLSSKENSILFKWETLHKKSEVWGGVFPLLFIFLFSMFATVYFPLISTAKNIAQASHISKSKEILSYDDGVKKIQENFLSLSKHNKTGKYEVGERMAIAFTTFSKNEKVSHSLKKDFAEKTLLVLKERTEKKNASPRSFLFLGEVYMSSGLYKNALLSFEKSVELSPNKQRTLFQLAKAQYLLGEKEKALSFLKKAYLLAPEYNEARIRYGALLLEGNEEQKKEGHFLLKEISFSSLNTKELMVLAQVFSSQGMEEDFIDVAKVLIEKDPFNPLYYSLLLNVYEKEGREMEKKSLLEKAQKIFPEEKIFFQEK